MNTAIKKLNIILNKILQTYKTGVDEAHQYYELHPKQKPHSDGRVVKKNGKYCWDESAKQTKGKS